VLYVVAIVCAKTNAKFKLRLKAPKGLSQAKMSCFVRPLITDLLKWHNEESNPKLKCKVGKQCPYVNFSHVEQSLLFNYLSDPEASQTTHDDQCHSHRIPSSERKRGTHNRLAMAPHHGAFMPLIIAHIFAKLENGGL
jgi:hypothetical protein